MFIKHCGTLELLVQLALGKGGSCARRSFAPPRRCRSPGRAPTCPSSCTTCASTVTFWTMICLPSLMATAWLRECLPLWRPSTPDHGKSLVAVSASARRLEPAFPPLSPAASCVALSAPQPADHGRVRHAHGRSSLTPRLHPLRSCRTEPGCPAERELLWRNGSRAPTSHARPAQPLPAAGPRHPRRRRRRRASPRTQTHEGPAHHHRLRDSGVQTELLQMHESEALGGIHAACRTRRRGGGPHLAVAAQSSPRTHVGARGVC